MLSTRRSTFHPFISGPTKRRQDADGGFCFSQERTPANRLNLLLCVSDQKALLPGSCRCTDQTVPRPLI